MLTNQNTITKNIAKIIDGRRIAERILNRLKKQPKPKKILAAVLVGRNPASISFLKQKEKAADSLGIQFQLYRFSSKILEAALKRKINQLNRDAKIGGIIIQLPLPKGINRDSIIALLAKNKDVDALKGAALVLPPAVGALDAILKNIRFALKGKRVVVIGRGLLVGKPIAIWLKNKVNRLDIFYSTFFDRQILEQADLIISGVGVSGLVKGSQIKKGAVLVDFGYSFKRGPTRTKRGLTQKIAGDFDFESCAKKAKYITPVPGGTGPILVAKLLDNFYRLTK